MRRSYSRATIESSLLLGLYKNRNSALAGVRRAPKRSEDRAFLRALAEKKYPAPVKEKKVAPLETAALPEEAVEPTPLAPPPVAVSPNTPTGVGTLIDKEFAVVWRHVAYRIIVDEYGVLYFYVGELLNTFLSYIGTLKYHSLRAKNGDYTGPHLITLEELQTLSCVEGSQVLNHKELDTFLNYAVSIYWRLFDTVRFQTELSTLKKQLAEAKKAPPYTLSILNQHGICVLNGRFDLRMDQAEEIDPLDLLQRTVQSTSTKHFMLRQVLPRWEIEWNVSDLYSFAFNAARLYQAHRGKLPPVAVHEGRKLYVSKDTKVMVPVYEYQLPEDAGILSSALLKSSFNGYFPNLNVKGEKYLSDVEEFRELVRMGKETALQTPEKKPSTKRKKTKS